MTKFRPCIDLHDGQVKQIVGGTLRDDVSPVENFVSSRPPGWFASKYASDGLTGGHVIKLGPGNDEAAKVALSAFPGGMQVGGGISSENAGYWLDCGASHVIITSWLFSADGKFRPERLSEIRDAVGAEKLVIDLSCRRVPQGNGGPAWCVAMNRWQKLTNMAVSEQTLTHLAEFASEFLVHAADVEGLCGGIDHELVAMLGRWGQLPITYAGGAASMQDVQLVDAASGGKVDVTVGSALDIFGGQGMKYAELVEWNGRK
ncbi:MAG: phosphoribosylformimino-5-aminoimidazole carboxamide ribotide isomerase [Planctomycetaceae bacterium TMED240]|nr:phosphoribosylformimino-5-aminoimidazole carboxamide ribotide isomerase [Rhodopirellula sp.]OUX06884.1 MAG: phosphoribosylformimino-5-aminoimidazole carboxamide ribotide isomerase [Planctomycetaceae bacterium TMED240]